MVSLDEAFSIPILESRARYDSYPKGPCLECRLSLRWPLSLVHKNNDLWPTLKLDMLKYILSETFVIVKHDWNILEHDWGTYYIELYIECLFDCVCIHHHHHHHHHHQHPQCHRHHPFARGIIVVVEHVFVLFAVAPFKVLTPSDFDRTCRHWAQEVAVEEDKPTTCRLKHPAKQNYALLLPMQISLGYFTYH